MQYEIYMKKCIELAKQAEGETSPNPLVGCVILNSDGQEIANGYHARYGENHAVAQDIRRHFVQRLGRGCRS